MVSFKHVKAHRTALAKAGLAPEEKLHAKGNEAADTWAKAGASGDGGFGREQVMKEVTEKIDWALNFVAESLDWPADFAKWEDTVTVLVKPKSLATLVIGPKAPHEFARSPDHPSQWVCRCCGARAFTAKQASKMQWKACPGTRLKKAARPKAERPFAEQAGGERSVTEVEPFLGHAMFRYGTLHYCSKCGYYAEHRSVGLERPCTGKPAAN